jgi:hypothetical protein
MTLASSSGKSPDSQGEKLRLPLILFVSRSVLGSDVCSCRVGLDMDNEWLITDALGRTGSWLRGISGDTFTPFYPRAPETMSSLLVHSALFTIPVK